MMSLGSSIGKSTHLLQHWKARTGRSVEIRQAHAGSSVQARAVIDGLEADVVTFNQVTDLDALVNAKLVSKDWRTKYPYDASPYRSIMAFIVRHGNPKGIKNWMILLNPGCRLPWRIQRRAETGDTPTSLCKICLPPTSSLSRK